MLEFLRECGVFGYLSVALIAVALAVVATKGRKTGRPCSMAAGFAVAILASGALGFAGGVNALGIAVMATPETDLVKRTASLAIGHREAVYNFVVAGGGALLVQLVGGLLAFGKKPQ